jgi:hypothetical protein
MRLGPTWTKCLGLCLALATEARAQTAPPIKTNDYAIDLTQGPVLASNRVVGLAGAFVAMADGVDGDSQNPASPAVRTTYSFTDEERQEAARNGLDGNPKTSGDSPQSGGDDGLFDECVAEIYRRQMELRRQDQAARLE